MSQQLLIIVLKSPSTIVFRCGRLVSTFTLHRFRTCSRHARIVHVCRPSLRTFTVMSKGVLTRRVRRSSSKKLLWTERLPFSIPSVSAVCSPLWLHEAIFLQRLVALYLETNSLLIALFHIILPVNTLPNDHRLSTCFRIFPLNVHDERDVHRY